MGLTDEDIHKDSLLDLFANRASGEAKYLTNDIIQVRLAKFDLMLDPLGKPSKEIINTTVGRYIFNLFLNDNNNPFFYKLNGFVNEPISKGSMSKIEINMAKALTEDRLTSKEYITYLDKRDWLGYSIVYFISPSVSLDIVLPNKKSY